MSEPILDVNDIEDITIIEIYNAKDKDNVYLEDIVMDFPEKYGIKPVSFNEVGLINACPDIKAYNYPVDTVTIDFYGKRRRKYIR